MYSKSLWGKLGIIISDYLILYLLQIGFKNLQLGQADLPREIIITRAHQLYIPTTGLNSKAINFIRRLASLHNP
jgi:hypothetical protein